MIVAIGVATLLAVGSAHARSLLMGERHLAFTPHIVGKALEIDAPRLVAPVILHQLALGLRFVELRLVPRTLATGA